MAVVLSRHATAANQFHGWPQLLFLFLFLMIDFCSTEGCYYSYNSTIAKSPDYVDPCTNLATTSTTLNCCALQSNNICLSNSLCFDPNQVGGSYYLSPCTDPTYTAPECPQYCSNRENQYELDVVYDSVGQIWRCCSTNPDGSANCSHPTDETFSAPPPGILSTIYPTLPSSLHSPTSTSASRSSLSSSAFSNPTTHSSIATAASSSSLLSSSASTNALIPTSTISTQPNSNTYTGLATADIVALSVGIPSTIATIIAAYFAYVAVRKKKR